MLGLAGLAFAACGNEEEVGGNVTPEGNGAVSIKIVTPTVNSRGVVKPDKEEDGKCPVERHHRTHVSAGRQGTGYFHPE